MPRFSFRYKYYAANDISIVARCPNYYTATIVTAATIGPSQRCVLIRVPDWSVEFWEMPITARSSDAHSGAKHVLRYPEHFDGISFNDDGK